ncbi:hypothetical protein HH310_25600 [Actinoplanes sp. TBRC 11911]|uniref:hypothetical protein n=1 Tax=Actinoplanes sp. TBRC 11911 TaxID=2729386 RepID=UPI00145E1A22|nr:hypothetical protein [Actinoplanes sp. TBRC 11911]NMO54545.1 hypothetical protein [Actinoplanes sp. TBRC 11911]
MSIPTPTSPPILEQSPTAAASASTSLPSGNAATFSTTGTATPPPAAATSTPPPGWLGPVLAALVSAAVALWLAAATARRKSREDERSRQRDLFTAAFQAYADYREMPYAIRRRRNDEAAAERVRLSEILREIQGRLTYYETWIAAESATVGSAYTALVLKARAVVGGAMREAWNTPAIAEDKAMNIPSAVVDLSSLAELQGAYVTAFHARLEMLLPWWKQLSTRLITKVRQTSPPPSDPVSGPPKPLSS